MLATPMDVLEQFPVRKTKPQKQAFRDAVQSYAETLGYPVTVEKGSFGAKNLIIGDPEQAKYLVTAHYDTCAWLPIPNLITPCNFWFFSLYQLLLGFGIAGLAMGLGVLVGVTVGLLFDPELGASLGGVIGYLMVWVLLALMLIGPANQNNANDNTSGVVTLLEIARTMPENQRHKVCFVLFDLEEAGLIGSESYRKTHKNASNRQLILNLDCVGDGDHILFFPTKKLRKDRKKLTSLYGACGYFGSKSILIREKGFSVYPSDQTKFPYGVGICALRKSKFGLYLGRIHTKKDTILEETNVNILRAALTTFICRDAANEERKMKHETL